MDFEDFYEAWASKNSPHTFLRDEGINAKDSAKATWEFLKDGGHYPANLPTHDDTSKAEIIDAMEDFISALIDRVNDKSSHATIRKAADEYRRRMKEIRGD